MDKKNITCCFTGPRPHKFSFLDNERHPNCVLLKSRLRALIIESIEKGFSHFICGGAIGFDTWAAIEIIKLKKNYNHILLELAIPCPHHNSSWSLKDKLIFEHTKKHADIVNYVSNAYFKACMHVRNQYMVNKSSLLIAVFANDGGTGSTIKYAQKKNIEIWYVGACLH